LEFSQVLKQLGVPDHIIGETTGIYKSPVQRPKMESAIGNTYPGYGSAAEKMKKKHSNKWKKILRHGKKFDNWL
jgi:hypothetical protein